MMFSTPFICRTRGRAFSGEQIARTTDTTQVKKTGRRSWLLHSLLSYLFVEWKDQDGEWGGAGVELSIQAATNLAAAHVGRLACDSWHMPAGFCPLSDLQELLPCSRCGPPAAVQRRGLPVPGGGGGAGRAAAGSRCRAAGGGQRGPAPLGGTAGSRTAPPYLRHWPARPGPARHSLPGPSDRAGQREPPAPPASLRC